VSALLRAAVARAYAELDAAGLGSGATGNVSALDAAAGVAAITPAGGRPGLSFADVSLVDLDGTLLAGGRPSSELATHLALLRGGAGAVAHAHAPYAVAASLIVDELPVVVAVQAHYCGGPVPVIAYVPTGTQEMADAVSAVQPSGLRAVIIRSHGPVTWAPTLELALAGLYAVEEAARAYVLARSTGAEPALLPPAELARLRPQPST
jgi:ribulose-5-phosphate 4-epimerase/fuculose-1-phosphate aldolase